MNDNHYYPSTEHDSDGIAFGGPFDPEEFFDQREADEVIAEMREAMRHPEGW